MSTFLFTIPDAPTEVVPAEVVPGSLNHEQDGLNRLYFQFQSKPKIDGLVRTLCASFQPIENALWELYVKRSIYSATGITLDIFGNLVNQPRNGLLDDDYRRYILAKVRSNVSGGTPEDLISICRLIINDDQFTLRYENAGIAAFTIYVENKVLPTATANIILLFLGYASAGGVRATLHFLTATPSTTFQLPLVATAPGSTAIAAASIVVNSTSGFPDAGTLRSNWGTSVQNTISYTSRTSTQFLGCTGITAVQPANSFFQLVPPQQGFSEGVAGTLGGKFSSIISS